MCISSIKETKHDPKLLRFIFDEMGCTVPESHGEVSTWNTGHRSLNPFKPIMKLISEIRNHT